MNTSGLRGFRELRTEHAPLAAPVHFPLPPKRHCQAVKANGKVCRAVIRPSNPSTICCPCAGHVDIRDWTIAIVELDDRPSTITNLAAVLTGEPPGNYHRVECVEEIRRLREGGVSHGQIAKMTGCKKTSVQKVLERQRAAVMSGPDAN